MNDENITVGTKHNSKKASVLIVLVTLIVLGGIGWSLYNDYLINRPPKDKVLALFKEDIDLSKSTYSADDEQIIVEKISQTIEDIRNKESILVEEVVGLGRESKNLGDFDLAIALFEIAESMQPNDLSFLIDKGRIYLELQQWEMARLVFEPMKQTWPIHEAYLGLAESYKHLDVPNYVIDQIYEESVDRHFAAFEVLEAYADWLVESGREELALPYYQMMNRSVPQKLLEDKIADLKLRYPNAKTLEDLEQSQNQ